MDFPAVLCIDDRLPVLELRKVTLEPHGYCVHIASSGHTAMKMLSETSMAAVLLEDRLEGMDSEAVASDIKQRFPDLPLILLLSHYRNGSCGSSNERSARVMLLLRSFTSAPAPRLLQCVHADSKLRSDRTQP